MRISGGALRGRRIWAPHGQTTRPTTDMVRQALFNIMGPPEPDAQVLDLYAGSGALGLEALSRGAGSVVFVEQDPRACQSLRRNLSELGLDARARVLLKPVDRALSLLAAEGAGPFRLIFADPPYGKGLGVALLTLLGQEGGSAQALLDPSAVVVLEHAQDRGGSDRPGARYGGLWQFDQRTYGQTGLSFYART